MMLHTSEIYLTDRALTDKQEKQLLDSRNAMAAFVHDEPMSQLPLSLYLPAHKTYGLFLGAVHIEQNPFNNLVSIHPMLIERDREWFKQVTEAAILWCINTHLVPTAQVRRGIEYTYMHNFLMTLGMIAKIKNEWLHYSLPQDWKPSSFSIYTMEFA